MAVAIFTVNTLTELAGKLTEHPIRGVNNNDIAIVIGGDYADDNIIFEALLTASPVTNMPVSLASDDGKVQWNVISRSFHHGGVPRSTQIKVSSSTALPSGWLDTNPENVQLNARLAASPLGTWVARGIKVGDDIWVIDGNKIGRYELNNNNKRTLYTIPALPDAATGYIQYQACAYCAEDHSLRIMGGYGAAQVHHHHFDLTTKVFTVSGKTDLPTATYLATLWDNSAIDGNMYLFTNGTDIMVYDVSGNSWGVTRTSKPWNVECCIVNDVQNPGKVFVVMQNHLYRYDPAIDDWDELAIGTSSAGYWLNEFWYNEATEEYCIIDNDDFNYYDPVLDSWREEINALLFPAQFDRGSIIPISDGYCFYMCSSDFGRIFLFAINEYNTMERG